MSDIQNIIEGNAKPPLEAIKNFSSPEKLAQHFRDIKAIVIQHVATTKEVPANFADMHILLSGLEDHFFALAVQNRYLMDSMPVIN